MRASRWHRAHTPLAAIDAGISARCSAGRYETGFRPRAACGRLEATRRTDEKGTDVTESVLDDLEWRGLIAHSTDLDALRAEMDAGPVRFYVGFDPTAPSLHMGNLLQILTARRLQDAGHMPVRAGRRRHRHDRRPARTPASGSLNSLDVVKAGWTRSARRSSRSCPSRAPNAATMVNNYDWTASLSTIDFLRDIGKHFPVNRMLARDVVRTRLEDGISYTEFSYVLLQSMDYLNLHRDYGVTLQFGGSDQWGNITAGVELIRRADGRPGARARDAAAHPGRRHEVRQDRGRRALARPGDAVAVRLLPVLAQRRGREGRRAAARLHVPRPRGDRGRSRQQTAGEAVPAGRAEGAGRAR